MLECGRLPVGYYGPCWNVVDCLWVIMVHVRMWQTACGLLWSMLECDRLPVGYYGPCWNVVDCLWVIMVHVGMW